ncbi:hypothetical protein [Methanococcoides burtonii]|uniref:Uncharacterized protein n=1 Tax=Methanococcoides burtonii (strain DSM 6242 / NBRC 107633 / OCM 468 / ACE-M) TaxID=259564 RepID=Q12Z98_METBU|nr:hypothetical protein [Methanococcoides burtonii]ABE51228.1 Hypothetical protein Mbur_0218 [Methanococcoides burtonii DSM 6242]
MNTKYVAIFLALLMVMSIITVFIPGSSNGDAEDNSGVELAGFESIPGEHVDHELNSLADGLAVTPEGVAFAEYVDVDSIRDTPLFLMMDDVSQLDSIYGVPVTKSYSARYTNLHRFNMHVINPEVIAFPYELSEEAYNGYYFASRGGDLYNVIGNPMLFGQQDRLEDALDVMEGDANASSDFSRVMEFVEPGASIQQVMVVDDGFADQYYLDLMFLDDSRLSRTTVYLNPTDGTRNNITAYAAEGTDKGLDYDIESQEDILKVTVTSNITDFYTLIGEPAW